MLLPLFGLAAEEKSTAPAAPKPKQFVYVLKLTPRLHDDAAWTDADKKIVRAHFAHLQAATKARQVIFAGRTMEPGDKTFGLVIFEAASDTEAAAFMQSDPAVAAGVMTATVHPYAVVLQRSEKQSPSSRLLPTFATHPPSAAARCTNSRLPPDTALGSR